MTQHIYHTVTKVQCTRQSNSVLERDGRKGSLAKFDCSVSFERFANVPFSEGMV